MFDLLIKNARIVDGSSSPWYRGDVAIENGKIAAIGKFGSETSHKSVDAKDKYLAPGFIDIHSHSDSSIVEYSLAESRILQGVTTEIAGNCGMSVFPILEDKRKLLEQYNDGQDFPWQSTADFFAFVKKNRTSVNFASLVGHGSLRLAAMGAGNGEATEKDIKRMQDLLRECMGQGALGMSSGLIYPPGFYSNTHELVEVASVLKETGGYYATHMRGEGTTLVPSVEEALETARRSGVPLQISHHKCSERSGWYVSVKTTVAMIEKARMEGVNVMCDQYPYQASATSLTTQVSDWAFEGGVEAMLERLKNPASRARLKEEANHTPAYRWPNLYISYVKTEKNSFAVGKSITEISEIWGKDLIDTVFDLILEEEGQVGQISFGMCEEDIEFIMKQSFTMIGSDGSAISLNYKGQPHPRYYATFPRVIAHYCRDRKLFPLETAIQKMTSMPAARAGFSDRGLIKAGMWADLVLFDFDTIKDTPTYKEPQKACDGILQVYVNGVLTAENGKHCGTKAGMVL